MDFKWTQFVSNYLKLSGFPCGEIGFINVYAPNNMIDFVYGS